MLGTRAAWRENSHQSRSCLWSRAGPSWTIPGCRGSPITGLLYWPATPFVWSDPAALIHTFPHLSHSNFERNCCSPNMSWFAGMALHACSPTRGHLCRPHSWFWSALMILQTNKYATGGVQRLHTQALSLQVSSGCSVCTTPEACHYRCHAIATGPGCLTTICVTFLQITSFWVYFLKLFKRIQNQHEIRHLKKKFH